MYNTSLQSSKEIGGASASAKQNVLRRKSTIGSNRGRKEDIPGKLIVVEGIDGSGKSTQLQLLEKWLQYNEFEVFRTEWNSSDKVRSITSKGKKKEILTPTTFSLLHATDFADRFERHILPLLHAGYFVLADRYVYTAYARDVTRRCDPLWIRKVYDFAIKPDITFYFRVPLDIAMDRILSGRPKIKFYEAGADLNLSKDIYESFRIFQSRIIEQYEKMHKREGFVVMDATLPIHQQQVIMRSMVRKLLPKRLKKKTQMEMPESV